MYSIDSKGHLDLYDMFKVRDVSHEYYFTELTNLVAWDGTPVYGMNSEAKWRHLICKHQHDRAPMNPLIDIELDRVMRLPVLKRALHGFYEADVYQQTNRKGNLDKIEVVVSGEEMDYLVSLGARGSLRAEVGISCRGAVYTRECHGSGNLGRTNSSSRTSPKGAIDNHRSIKQRNAPHFGPRGKARSKALSKGLNH